MDWLPYDSNMDGAADVHYCIIMGNSTSETFEEMVTYQTIFIDFQGKYRENYQKHVGCIVKSYIFASPLKKEGKTADVAQLARARDL